MRRKALDGEPPSHLDCVLGLRVTECVARERGFELQRVLGEAEVYEAVSRAQARVQIHQQVQEVDFPEIMALEHVEDIISGVLIRYAPHHHRGTKLFGHILRPHYPVGFTKIPSSLLLLQRFVLPKSHLAHARTCSSPSTAEVKLPQHLIIIRLALTARAGEGEGGAPRPRVVLAEMCFELQRVGSRLERIHFLRRQVAFPRSGYSISIIISMSMSIFGTYGVPGLGVRTHRHRFHRSTRAAAHRVPSRYRQTAIGEAARALTPDGVTSKGEAARALGDLSDLPLPHLTLPRFMGHAGMSGRDAQSAVVITERRHGHVSIHIHGYERQRKV